MKIAIDGPAGAGKSTIAKAVAKELGFLYIDTGAMYRAIGLKALSMKLDEDIDIAKMTGETDIEITLLPDGQHIILDGSDVTDKIRTPEVSMAASRVSAIGEVRKTLVELQRKIAGKNDVIMDGRDIGTVVLPEAEVKLFLTASAEDRARRRYEEMLQKGEKPDYESVLEDMKKRDYNDSHRAVSPLKAAEDAYIMDTTGNTLEKSVKMITDYIKEAVKRHV